MRIDGWDSPPTGKQRFCAQWSPSRRTEFSDWSACPRDGDVLTSGDSVDDVTSVVAQLPDGYLAHVSHRIIHETASSAGWVG